MPDREQGSMRLTDFGWSIQRETPPERIDLLWVHESSGDVYRWDGDGWYRMRPPDNKHWKT